MSSVSEVLAGFAHQTSSQEIPQHVMDKTKLLILDGVGMMLAAASEEFAKGVIRAIEPVDAGGPCTVVGLSRGFSLVHAPLVNGMLIHAFDFDDTHHPLVIHNESVVLPVALACAEHLGSSGQDVVVACAVGFETSLRVARGTQTNSIHRRGFHPTAVCGVFGGAATAGRLLGLTEEHLVYALGLAGAQGSGNMEWQSDGSWSKRFQPGWSAHAAMVGTLVAREGFTAPRTAIEGPRGFWASHVGEENFDSDRTIDGIGVDWELDRTEFKPYPCGGVLQAMVRACVEIHRTEGFDPLEIEDVECRVRWNQHGVERVNSSTPSGDYGAHFSIPFIAGNALYRGRLALVDFEGDNLRDAKVTGISERVRIVDDPLSGRPKYASGEVEVRMNDGRVFNNRQHIHPGHVENPVTPAEVVEKFLLNARRALSKDKAQELADRILSLEIEPDLSAIVEYLRIAQ
jgi:2-methylcitrate dehydratase PrpD